MPTLSPSRPDMVPLAILENHVVVAAVRFRAGLTGCLSPVGLLSGRALHGYVRTEGQSARWGQV